METFRITYRDGRSPRHIEADRVHVGSSFVDFYVFAQGSRGCDNPILSIHHSRVDMIEKVGLVVARYPDPHALAEIQRKVAAHNGTNQDPHIEVE